jgi:oligopeptide/dipeptide ABC transporter ATP-binding protein
LKDGASPVLSIRNLRTSIQQDRATVHAVDGLSLSIDAGETLGLVGESGSGKSMTAMSIMRLLPQRGAIVGGSIVLNGREITGLSEKEMRRVRGNEAAMIFQDPLTSLNPTMTIGDQIVEAVLLHKPIARHQAMKRVEEVLELVRVPRPKERMDSYPHQLSGGLRQRVMIAIALSCSPSLLIADEPTTALDVTIQLQYLKLLKRLQQETGTAILFITHDFGVVSRMCDRVAVMYAGRIVECGPVRQILESPAHPYTQALIASVPKMTGPIGRLTSIEGQPPSLMDLPAGCRFAARCAFADSRFQQAYPGTHEVSTGHTADCWRLAPA